ncbi:hypothetical protein E3Q09_03988 [Wallemia mellicola]|nr:hypothetical protein E3Q09_03988 [Wallemia mellicola]
MFQIKTQQSHPHLPDLGAFIHKSLRRTRLPSEITILVVALLVRLKSRWPQAASSSTAAGQAGHRLWLAAFMIAYKTSIDDCFSNASIVALCQGSYKLSQINAMERELLILLDYQTHFNDKEIRETRTLFGDPPPIQVSVDKEMSRLSITNSYYEESKPIPVQLKSHFSSPSSSSSISSDEDSFYCQSSPDTMPDYHPYAYPEFK